MSFFFVFVVYSLSHQGREDKNMMEKLHGKDAHVIPWDTRMKQADKVCDQVS